MKQPSLRLGDIVDDYCPRERRITNHAVVAIVEDAIRQTRCTTCDYEHVFKQAREPKRRTKPAESLYDQVLADVAGGQLVAAREAAEEVPPPVVEAAVPADDAPPAAPHTDETSPAHRTLIRATLPKTDAEPPPRPIPEFTMHQKPQPARGRGAFRRLAFGPQGDPFGPAGNGRPGGGSVSGHGQGGRNGDSHGPSHGNGNGNGTGGNGAAPGQRRGRRRRGGKRSH